MKRLAPENLSEIEARNYRCYFWAFQLELRILDTEKFEHRFSRRKVTVNSASVYSKCCCTLKLQCEDWHLRSVIHTQSKYSKLSRIVFSDTLYAAGAVH